MYRTSFSGRTGIVRTLKQFLPDLTRVPKLKAYLPHFEKHTAATSTNGSRQGDVGDTASKSIRSISSAQARPVSRDNLEFFTANTEARKFV
jgi:hypothetical protein